MSDRVLSAFISTTMEYNARSVDRILRRRSARTRSGWRPAPPTNSEYQVRRAFDAGWGGAVWKTLGDEPIVNVSSRYGGIDYDGRKVMGLNNIELITDRPLDVNLKEISPRQEGVSRSCALRLADGRVEARGLARDHSEDAGRRRRRHRAELRLPARHERARHGLGGRPGSRLRLHDHRMGQGSRRRSP